VYRGDGALSEETSDKAEHPLTLGHQSTQGILYCSQARFCLPNFPRELWSTQGSLEDPRQTPQYLKIVIILLLNRNFISFNALMGFGCLKPSQTISKLLMLLWVSFKTAEYMIKKSVFGIKRYYKMRLGCYKKKRKEWESYKIFLKSA